MRKSTYFGTKLDVFLTSGHVQKSQPLRLVAAPGPFHLVQFLLVFLLIHSFSKCILHHVAKIYLSIIN